jgi:HK97 family phage portal protein
MVKKAGTTLARATKADDGQTITVRGKVAIALAQALRAAENIVPDDPGFFRALRIRLEENTLTKPYAQNPWVYSANQAIVIPITLVPFNVYRQTKGEGRGTLSARIDKMFDVLRDARVRRVTPSALEEVALHESPRARFHALVRKFPWIPGSVAARATGGVEPLTSGPWVQLFAKPNRIMTRAQLWEANFVLLGVHGECFWTMGSSKGGKVAQDEVPFEVYPGAPAKWSARIDKATKLPKAWDLKLDEAAKPDTYELWQVLHPSYYNPYEPFRGLSPLSSVKGDIEQQHLAAQYNTSFFKGGAIPGGYLMTDKTMTQDAAMEYLETFERRHGGAKKGHRPTLLDSGMKFVESMSNHKDMEFGALMDRVRDTVLSGAYRVTKNMTGLSGDQNRASMEASIKNHWDSVLLPKTRYMEDLLDADLFTPERAAAGGGDVFGAWDLSSVTALREDLALKLEAGERLFRMGYPANVINEALEMGLPELPPAPPAGLNGAQVTAATAIVISVAKGEIPRNSGIGQLTLLFGLTLEQAEQLMGDAGKGTPTQPNVNPLVDGGGDGGDDPPPAADDTADEKGVDDTAERAALRARARDVRIELGFPAIVRTSSLHTEEHWDFLVETLFVGNEHRFSKKFKSYLYRIRTAQLHAISEATSITDPAQLVFPLKHWQDVAAEMHEPVYRAIVRAADAEAREEVAKSKKSAERGKAKKTTEDRIVAKLTKDLGRTTSTVQKRVRRAIQDVIEKSDYDKADINAAVKDVFNQLATGGKVGQIARTETGFGVSEAREAVFDELGVKEGDWLTAGDEHVRDNHVIYGEQGTVPRGTNWAAFAGESYTLEFPLDSRAPGKETIGCRCALVPR